MHTRHPTPKSHGLQPRLNPPRRQVRRSRASRRGSIGPTTRHRAVAPRHSPRRHRYRVAAAAGHHRRRSALPPQPRLLAGVSPPIVIVFPTVAPLLGRGTAPVRRRCCWCSSTLRVHGSPSAPPAVVGHHRCRAASLRPRRRRVALERAASVASSARPRAAAPVSSAVRAGRPRRGFTSIVAATVAWPDSFSLRLSISLSLPGSTSLSLHDLSLFLFFIFDFFLIK
ncbi:hypothetical protein Scep_010184 [Stephania cephalantha]|uniref:Uncharacterized protein n=1 Tax=Stephania cephalantha TaxID=152367 RepID=A0AAP0JUJ1_9MAGN